MKRRALLTVGALGTLGGVAGLVRAQAPREIEINALRFRFIPNEIPLKAGERVVLLVRALDFPHGFNIPDLKIRADLVIGKTVRIELQAPAATGPLDFLCDNFCGEGHETMHGQFVVST